MSNSLAFVSLDIGALYHRYSSPPSAALVSDLLQYLQPLRQIRTTAHPLVEISLMRQPARRRTLPHFVNLSGHAGTTYFRPVEMRGIEVKVIGKFAKAATAGGKSLAVISEGAHSRITLLSLTAYEVLLWE